MSTTDAVELYAEGLRRGRPVAVRQRGGALRALPVHDWTVDELPGDHGLVRRCAGPVLDVGCGPGRLTAALAARGRIALGVDVAPAAVELTLRRGAVALERCVFGHLPAQGRWGTALLADGNIGIGGDVVRLLRRLLGLLRPRGTVLAEVGAPGTGSGRRTLRLEQGGRVSPWFPWADLACDDAPAVARRAGLHLEETWSEAGRHFVHLVAP
jgi:SAM-dependent methyltransferase